MAEPADPFDLIVEAPFDSALSERYLVYALSTITARSLPDVRDGLKPVHRRLLWAMRLLRLDPGYKKCARVVGDVIGKYHPHGDASIYDAMVRLAQSFALRYPLVDGQGNFGNIDGDNAAAMRYTEARLTAAANDLMAGLDEGTVDFRPTYNGEEEEPEIFPGLFPNLLANGASGIAVGMATSIPPHNLEEVVDASIHFLENPKCNPAELMQFVQGPDFPTGGLIVDSPETIAHAYATGRGSFRVRARFAPLEKGPQGSWSLVITEIPYQVMKSKLIEQIAALVTERKLPILADVRDESDEQIRIVLEPRSRTVDPEMLKDSLYRLTDLETRIPLNLNVLDAHRVPQVMSLAQVLDAWLEHQIEVLVRRSKWRLAKIEDRIELLDGFLIAYLNLDRVIQIIREEDEPKPIMMEEFSLSDRQAEAILNMRLRSLRRLEEMEIGRERKTLDAEAKGLKALLKDPKKRVERLKNDLGKLKERYGKQTELGKRRTDIEEAGPAREIPLEAMIEREPVTVVMSQRGWIRALRGHVDLASAETMKFKEGDGPAFAFHTQTTDKLMLAADNGRFYTLAADKLPGGRGFGEPVRLMVDIDDQAGIVALRPFVAGGKLLMAASDGRGFVAKVDDLLAETRKGRQVVTPRAGAKLRVVYPIPADADHVAAIGDNRKMVVYPLAELPEMARGQGVQLQRYRQGGLSDAIAFRLDQGLSWTMAGESRRTRTETDLANWKTVRGTAGRLPPTGFPKENRFIR